MKIKHLFIGIFLGMMLAVGASAQDCPSPQGCVLITREAALKALADADRVVALEAENAILKDAINGTAEKKGYKDLLADMKIEFARMSGENTALKQNAVSDRAIMEILVKNSRKKCAPLSVCF